VHATRDNLTQHLAHEASLMREFIAILDEEARTLSAPAVGAALDAITARKHGHADKLQVAAQTRCAHLAQLGFADVQEDLAPVVERHPELRPAIDALIALAAQARAKNQENGIVIQTYQRHYQDALTALQALAGAGDKRLYDARGRSKPVSSEDVTTHIAV